MSTSMRSDDPDHPSYYAKGKRSVSGPAEPRDLDTPWSRQRQPWSDEAPLSPEDAAEVLGVQPFERAEPGHRLPLSRSLDPDPVPPMRRERRGSAARTLVRFGVAVAAAAGVAVLVVGRFDGGSAGDKGVTDLLVWVSGLIGAAAPAAYAPPPAASVSSAPPRLAVQDGRGDVNQAVALGLSVDRVVKGAVVVMTGFATGTQLTAGRAIGPSGWRISAGDLVDVAVLPPRDFAGTMEVAVYLRLGDDSVADKQTLRLTWGARAPQPAVAASAVPQAVAQSPVAVVTTVPVVITPPSAPAPAPTPVARDLPADEIAMLLKRGEEFVGQGDFAAARLVLRRAAEARDARAAFALAATYDPAVLQQVGAVGIAPDAELARRWYERAAEYGSADASRRLEMLARGR